MSQSTPAEDREGSPSKVKVPRTGGTSAKPRGVRATSARAEISLEDTAGQRMMMMSSLGRSELSAAATIGPVVSAVLASKQSPPTSPAPETSAEPPQACEGKSVRPVSAAPMSAGEDRFRPVSAAARPQTAATSGSSAGGRPLQAQPHPQMQLQPQATIPPAQPQATAGAPGRAEDDEVNSRNWRIFGLYTRHEYKGCAVLIEEQLRDHPKCEYALYVRALIRRQQGDIAESLRLFEQCHAISPSANNVKQIARSYFLLGKHKAAIQAFEKVEKVDPNDWETWHNKGVCHMYLRNYAQAADCLRKANSIARHDCTYIQLGKLYTVQENFPAAIEILVEGLEFSPENPEILTAIGLLYLRTGENYRAFEHFNNALLQDPVNPKTILAAGSLIQDHSEVEVALVKYRIAAVHTPHSAQLWNNIGMCFFSKQK